MQKRITRVLRFAVLLVLYHSPQIVIAQQRLFTNQQHFGVEEGLPQSYIGGIVQDDDGFIWLATLDGLSRYDGRGFKNIHYNPKDSTGLSSNVINDLGKLINNTLTVNYTSTQADAFNTRTFKTSRNNIREQLSNIPYARWQSGRVGINTANRLFMVGDHKGIGWLNSNTGKVYYANKANGLLKQDTISFMVESGEGKLYLVSKNGVQLSDITRSKFEWISFPTNVKEETPEEIANPYVSRYNIVYLQGNRLAISEEDKIILLDIDNKTSTIIKIPASPITRAYPGNSELKVDSRGRAYFENGGRIFRITETGEPKMLWENTANPTLRVSAYFIDRTDVLWLSVNAQGLLKIDLQSSLFESYSYRTNFIQDILEKTGAKPGTDHRRPIDTETSYSLRQTYDTKRNMFFSSRWTGSDKIYQLNQQGLQLFLHLPANTVYTAMLTMPGDEIWALDAVAPAWYCWKTPSSVPEKLVLDKSIKELEIVDAKYFGGYSWISTANNGLLQCEGAKIINKFAGQLSNGNMPATLTEICADPGDTTKFWIGSRGGGLILWDVQKGLQRIYTTEDGLPNNTTYCILPDKDGKIWCSTNKGIFRLDKTTGQVTAFEKTDGLPGNEFNRAHKLMFYDGRLAFGGLDGYTIFNPADFNFKNTREKVPLMLTGLQVNNVRQDMNLPASVIKQPLSTVTLIELPYDKNYLRFEFAALLFNQPQKTKYRYQLEGVDKDWIENGNSNIASYTALRPGHYTFRINASDIQGLWSNEIREIVVIIRPPFWATWWAYIVYALLLIVLIRWYFIFRDGRLKTEQNLAFEKKEALRLKEVDELKDRFFSNVTHEFRTPLTLIITPLEKLSQDPSLSAAALSTVETAQRNSRQLLQLINEFLDFSKLNDGQLKLKLSTGELDLFTGDCVRSFESAAKEKNIEISFSSREIAGFYLFDEEKWRKIISNLLSNALKFTPCGGRVSVSLSSSPDDRVSLEVKDNGPGIPADQQQKIFDRFYQVDDSAVRTYGGTGIGLSLVKELTGLMHGTVHLESTPGGPTSFLVTVPMTKDAPLEVPQAYDTIQPGKEISHTPEQDAPLVLVVEDNDELRSFLIESMSKRYRVVEAADGLKAWEIILQELPDIVISDVMMPGQDGFDLCRMCKSDNRTAHIGFILLTSKAARDARLKGLETGADDYISKPFNLQELQLRTANLLQLQQKQRTWLQAKLITTAPPVHLPEITDPFLVELYLQMDAKLDDPGLGVDYLCKAMAMSRSTLHRKLKSLLDISTNDLIRQYRLQKASGLISSGLDISTVAYQVGFSSHSYFSQCFKEQYGITPSEYLPGQN